MRTASTAARALLTMGLLALISPAHSEERALINTLDSSPKELEQFLSSRALEPVHKPDLVEAFEVKMTGTGLSSQPVISTTVVQVNPQDARKFSKALLRVDSYMLNAESACLFEPGILLKFHKETRAVGVLVCFKCGEALFTTGDGTPISERLKLDSGKKRLLAIAKRVFPQNRELKEIE